MFYILEAGSDAITSNNSSQAFFLLLEILSYMQYVLEICAWLDWKLEDQWFLGGKGGGGLKIPGAEAFIHLILRVWKHSSASKVAIR